MSAVPPNLSYTKTHEWARRDGAELVIGITSHAQEELRDVVFVELPKVGKSLKQAEPAAVIESVKAAFDIYVPLSGTITRVNDAVAKSPQLVNEDCYGQGWLFAIAPSALEEVSSLLTADEYMQRLQSEKH